MKKRTKLVLDYLKPKVKALGFNKEELESIAADIADNLNLEETASDEEEDEAAKTAAESAIPYLKIAQRASGRVIQKFKDEQSVTDDDDNPVPSDPKPNQDKKDENVPAWASALIESNNLLKQEIAAMKGENLAKSRRQKMAELLKDSGTFGDTIMESLGYMEFKTDEDFEDFKAKIEEKLAAHKQEEANNGLKNLGHPNTGGKSTEIDDKPATDKEIEDVLSIM